MKLFHVKYRVSLIGGYADPIRDHQMHVEARTLEVAARLAAKLGRRACKALGDEKFVRLLAVKEKGEVARG